MKALNITELVAARVAAKKAEDAAIQARRDLDEQISLALSSGKTEGTESRKIDELGLKVSVTYGVTRKVDSEALSKAWAKLSDDEQAAFKWDAKVSVSTLRKIEGKSLTTVSKFIESKPAAPSVKVELI